MHNTKKHLIKRHLMLIVCVFDTKSAFYEQSFQNLSKFFQKEKTEGTENLKQPKF